MSQFVWTCACGWKTTAENSSRGHRGEAPKACRRCGSERFAVTTEKHPKVTIVCKDPDCRQDFIAWVGAKYCARCMPKHRGSRIWEGRRKYNWTPERDQILKDHYKNNPTELAERFFKPWPKWVVVKRAGQLGLSRVKEKPWTKAEDAFVREHAGSRTANWMARQLRTRTETAIVVRLKRMNISRRIQADGLTMGQLEKALGVDHRQIAGWWRSGRLKGVRRDTDRTAQQGGDPYVFNEADIAKFLIDNPSAFRLDRVDQAWFMGLMRDAVSASRWSSQPAVDGRAQRQPRQKSAKSTTAAAATTPDQLTACIGVDAATPCPLQKQVAAKPHIPARCPDCKLELKRRFHREESERLKRIRSVSAPAIEKAS